MVAVWWVWDNSGDWLHIGGGSLRGGHDMDYGGKTRGIYMGNHQAFSVKKRLISKNLKRGKTKVVVTAQYPEDKNSRLKVLIDIDRPHKTKSTEVCDEKDTQRERKKLIQKESEKWLVEEMLQV